jgi:ankyrin repeat protein
VSIPDNGLTPLGMAIKHRHLSIAEYLIDKGANVNAINKVSITSLEYIKYVFYIFPLLIQVLDKAIHIIQCKL